MENYWGPRGAPGGPCALSLLPLWCLQLYCQAASFLGCILSSFPLPLYFTASALFLVLFSLGP